MSRVLLLSILCCTSVLVGGLNVIKLYVNRVLAKKADVSTKANVNNIVNFTYVEGDSVELSCIRLTSICKLKLSFDFFDEHIGGNGSIAESIDPVTEFKNGVGLRTTLQSKHNDASVVCTCAGHQHTSIVTVTFVLTNCTGSTVDLRIDGYIVRQHEPTDNSVQVYCACDETLHLEWEATTENVALEAYQFAAQGLPKKAIHEQRVEIINCLQIHSILIQYVTSNNGSRHSTEVYFDKYYIATPDHRAPLVVNTSHSLLQLYDFNGRQVIYYDYEENETLTISCGVPAKIATNVNSLIFGDTVEINHTSIVKKMCLSAADDSKSVDCNMLKNFDNKTAKHTRLVWRRKPPAVTSANTEQWLIAAGSGVACGVVLLACVSVLCMRRRTRLRVRDENSELKLCENDAIPSYQLELTSQATPANKQRVQPAHSEVIPSVSYAACTRETAPDSGSQNTATTPNIIYAVLDLASSSRGSKRFHTEESPYAEVLQINISEQDI